MRPEISEWLADCQSQDEREYVLDNDDRADSDDDPSIDRHLEYPII